MLFENTSISYHAPVILVIRTWVLWDKRKSILIATSTVGIGSLLCAIIVVGIWSKSMLGRLIAPTCQLCYVDSAPFQMSIRSLRDTGRYPGKYLDHRFPSQY